MRLVVFSDVHSNLEALLAFFQEIEHVEYDKIIGLGDLSGYCANPNECIELMIEKSIPSVIGNHDESIANDVVPWEFNHMAQKAVIWQINHVKNENKEWLRVLPDFIYENTSIGKAAFAHGSPESKFDYIHTNMDARFALNDMRQKGIDLSFVGHTHVPGAFIYRKDKLRKESSVSIAQMYTMKDRELDAIEEISLGETIKLEYEDRAIINVGSIGQSRDKKREGCYVIFDDESMSVTFNRFSYPHETTAKKILSAGLPPYLAERLEHGR